MASSLLLSQRPRVEQLLSVYRDMIGSDYAGYRNHVYRTVTYALHFLNDRHQQLVETALVYHDLGLWTDRQLAYLEPSEALALRDNEKYGWGLDPEALGGIIHWHHKIFRYTGPHAEVIEACRKADWVDATQGWLRKGLRRDFISRVETEFPNCGFHASLMRLAKDYGGSSLVGGCKVMWGILKW